MDPKFRSRTSWREKLDRPSKVVKIPPKMQARFGRGKMLIPRPLDGNCTCPITTGIFVRIAAEAAEEDRAAGRARVTPYWRVVRDDGRSYIGRVQDQPPEAVTGGVRRFIRASLIEKFPGGPAAQAQKLADEGFDLAPGRGRRPPRVPERHLVKLI